MKIGLIALKLKNQIEMSQKKQLIQTFLLFRKRKICFSDFEKENLEFLKQIKDERACFQKPQFENKQMVMSLD